MASQEIQRLWKLARIDAGLLEVRMRAGALDAGASIVAEIERMEKEDATVGARARALHAELRDLELHQKTIEDKVKKIDKELFSGRVVSSREVENLEKEKASLRRQRDRDDERLLELFDLVPPAQADAKKITDRIAALKVLLPERRQKAAQEKKLLETEFARLSAARPDLAKSITPALLARYDSIRQRYSGVGMVEVNGLSCGGCGTNIPERTLQALREDKVGICESCHRLLYYTEGVI